MNDLRTMWRELWWYMAKGQKLEYDSLKGTDVFEFWTMYDLWKQQTAREREALQSKARKKSN